jgi:hypothetical protein
MLYGAAMPFHVVNPGATGFEITDVEALYASLPPGTHPVVDLGAGFVVTLETVRAAAHLDLDELADLVMLDQPGWEQRL